MNIVKNCSRCGLPDKLRFSDNKALVTCDRCQFVQTIGELTNES